MKTVRVLFCCTGVGIMNRGIESFFREAFDGLKATPGLECLLLKGAGEEKDNEKRVFCLSRDGRLAAWAGLLLRRAPYVAEQLSSFPDVARHIRRFKPHVVFYSDANLGFQLYFRRKWIGVPYRLLFSNGGPIHPPFVRTDYVQQVAPHYYEEAVAAGESTEKHFMVPYGINVGDAPAHDATLKNYSRAELGLPLDRQIVLSVGWIARQHKRMHYVIEEIARLKKPRPFLLLLGAMDEHSKEIIELGKKVLGPENFSARSVPYERVADYYRAADIFVLASLKEGFGRVYLEALMHGLPTIAHRYPVMDFVLGDVGIKADLSRDGELGALLAQELKRPFDMNIATQRWQSVRDRFGWEKLASQYSEMFFKVAS